MLLKASGHRAQISTQVLRTMLSGRLISHFWDITWLTHLPDLVIPDYFLWGFLTNKVYERDPTNTNV